MVRIKITTGMIDAGEAALMRCAEDYSISQGEPLPDFDGMSDEQKAEGRRMVSEVLKAAADHYAMHGNQT